MPVAKDLYIAKSIGDLNKLAEVNQKITNVKIFVKSAEKVFRDAEDSFCSGDEEKAYVMYMKYFNIITAIKKTGDFKKNEKYYKSLIGIKNSMRAIEAAEQLSKSLQNRYDLREAEDLVKKLDSIEKNAASKDQVPVNGPASISKEDEKDVEDVPQGAITCKRLFKLLKDPSSSVLIMDARTQHEFLESHIKYTNIISVPEEGIAAGCVSRHITANLPSESKHMWNIRGSMDYIILLDWSSTVEDLTVGKPLKSLKDAIYKWENLMTLKHEPLVLDGGYEAWLLFYPTVTTNANVRRPKPTNELLTPNLLEFDYPDFDEMFSEKSNVDQQSSPEGEESSGPTLSLPPSEFLDIDKSSSKETNNILKPSIDRSKKPNKKLTKSLSEDSATIIQNNLWPKKEDNLENRENLESFIKNKETAKPSINRSLKPQEPKIQDSEIMPTHPLILKLYENPDFEIDLRKVDQKSVLDEVYRLNNMRRTVNLDILTNDQLLILKRTEDALQRLGELLKLARIAEEKERMKQIELNKLAEAEEQRRLEMEKAFGEERERRRIMEEELKKSEEEERKKREEEEKRIIEQMEKKKKKKQKAASATLR